VGYLKLDGTPRYVPKNYEVKGNLQRKKRFVDNKQKKRLMAKWRRFQSKIIRRHHRNMRTEERQALMLAELNGTLDEMHDLMVAVKQDPTVSSTSIKRTADGTIIPVHVPVREPWEDKICELITCGSTLKEVCKIEGMPTHNRVRKLYRESIGFKRQLDQAYTDRADYYVDQLYELMSEVKSGTTGTREASFVADQIRWLAERLSPKFMQKGNGKLDINLDNMQDGKVQFNIILAGGNESKI
jgi:hypothetical protein